MDPQRKTRNENAKFSEYLMQHLLKSPKIADEIKKSPKIGKTQSGTSLKSSLKSRRNSKSSSVIRASCASIKSSHNTTITIDGSSDDDGIIDMTLLSDDSRFAYIRTPRLQTKRKWPCDSGGVTCSTSPRSIPNKVSKREKNQLDTSVREVLKTSTPDLLVRSKRQNIEKWICDNAIEVVETPPFSGLSPKRLSNNDENDSDCSLDKSCKEVLEALYGANWRNVNFKSKTDVKKPTFISRRLSSSTRKKGHPVRRNIFNTSSNDIMSPKSGINQLDSSSLSTPDIIRKPVRKAKRLLDLSVDTPTPSQPLEHLQTPKTPLTTAKMPLSTAKTPKRTFLASLSVSSPNSISHPQAYDYKVNFKTKKQELLARLFKLYNQEVFGQIFPEDMSITWNTKLRGTAGYCYNRKLTKRTGEILRSARIELATKIIDRADRLRDTLIHEMCHAAAWVVDGVLDGHGPLWQQWTDRARARFPELPPIKRCHNYEIVGKFTYKCTNCGYSIPRHSRSIDINRKRCGYCFGHFELLVNKMKKGKTEVPEFDTTRTMRTPNKFALFVKENYNSVKSELGLKKHGEIMKIISEQYRIFKNVTESSQKKK